MNKSTIMKYAAGIMSVAMLFGAFAASAGAASSAGTAKQAAALTRVIDRGDQQITARIASLNALDTRIQAMKNVSSSEQATLVAEAQTSITNLTTLKGKIDGDTDVATARADVKTITADYRIYALIIPRGYIVASADRVETIDGLMTTLSAQLQTKITAAQSAGKDVTTLQSALSDMNAKVADAETQAQTAQTGVVSLAPDQGSTTVAASNKAALVASRADIKTATSDLKAARADIKTITQGLK